MPGRQPQGWPRSPDTLKGRDLQFGISAFVICRETLAAAQAEHARLYALRSEEAIPGVDRQVVMIRTYAYARGYVGSNGGTAAGLVGTSQDIAGRLQEFLDIGVTTFLLQFHPMREEMARFGEQVVPLLAQAGIWRPPCWQGGQHNGHQEGALCMKEEGRSICENAVWPVDARLANASPLLIIAAAGDAYDL